MTEPSIGDEATVFFTVSEDATAIALGSGDVPVLGTPKVVALCEEAAVAAIAGAMRDGATSVGTRIVIDHVAPTPVGGMVSATASVSAVGGRTVEFALQVYEDDTVVATGTHTRVIVDRATFLSRLA